LGKELQMETIERDLFRLEQELINAAGPEGGKRLAALLADDFVEVGASGRVYSRVECLAELAAAPRRLILRLEDFRVRPLGSDSALVTYTVHLQDEGADDSRLTRRSSLWARDSSGWRVLYHQGTTIPQSE
jgi:hypothetical protein